MAIERKKELLLWENLKNGDDTDFSHFYDNYVDFLFSVGIAYSNDKDLIKDSIHDLFIDLYKYRRKLSVNVNVKGYLIKSLKRKISSNQKKSGKLTLKETLLDSDYPTLIQESFIHGKENALIKKLLIQIDRLPERQKEALVLKYQNELSYPEIAEILNISVESARTLVYRTIKSLRKNLSNIQSVIVGLMFFFNNCF
uniref:RNA polymerase sigma factor n=1 Tax=uncultured Draconibacterium sp. TaxID=1573823 RepID=UPI003216A1C1